ncbi:MAG TPA: hypothetical protein VMG12_10575 [Polyangiaceae bacterium]|nr:hypothetical protein [Polyangiaceae bacterium]
MQPPRGHRRRRDGRRLAHAIRAAVDRAQHCPAGQLERAAPLVLPPVPLSLPDEPGLPPMALAPGVPPSPPAPLDEPPLLPGVELSLPPLAPPPNE